MRVRVRLYLNACVSRRMRESWQLWIGDMQALNCSTVASLATTLYIPSYNMNHSHTVMQSSLYQTSADSPMYKMNVLDMWTQTTEMRL